MLKIDEDQSILFLDDCPNRTREFKSHFPWAKTVETAQECIDALKSQEWNVVCLDHDLGGETYVDENNKNTGSEVVRFIVENKPDVGIFIVHSLNVFAAKNMEDDLTKVGYDVVRTPFIAFFNNYKIVGRGNGN